MKCPNYYPEKNGSCHTAGYKYCDESNQCSNGWIVFWTPAERAGLKAMGKLHHDLSISGWYARDAEDAIRVYVRAARGIKEED